MSKLPVPSFWPREHGAYAQLGIALAAGLALAPALRSLAQCVLTAGLFLASEPLLVLLGRRGEADPGTAGRARHRMGCLVALAALSGAAAWIGLPFATLVSLAPAGLLGLGLFGLFLARRERTPAGEELAALTFAAAALPVALLGGAGARDAAAMAVLLGTVFTIGTALVHGHLFALRRRGAQAPRLAAFLAGSLLTAGVWALAGRSVLPRSAWLATLPMTLAGLAIWLFPPAPRRLRAVGWTAAACALAGASLAVVCLRG
jgi:hypothetical protein